MRGALATVALFILAGCAGDEQTTVQDVSTCVVEAADDYSCELDENKTGAEVAHLHDYWRGQETARILEQTQGFGSPNYSHCGPYPVMRFYPDEDKTVYQGTGLVEIEMSFTPGPDHVAGAGELWIRRADQDAAEYVADIADGDISIDVPYNASDLPHQVLSAWEFWVYFNHEPSTQQAGCQTRPRGTFTLGVDIHKTYDIEPFPGHPDHWANATELLLLQEYAYFDFTSENIGSCLSGNGTSHQTSPCQAYWDGMGPRLGRIVPPGASIIRVTLTADPSSSDVGTELGLRFHGGDTRQFEDVEPIERDGDVAIFEIDADKRTDGPYAEQSQWRFQVVHDTTSGIYQGGWTLDGVAIKGD